MNKQENPSLDVAHRRLDPPASLIEQIRSTDPKSAEIVEALILIREEQRDLALAALQNDMDDLVTRLKSTIHQILVEELACFKDIIDLHGTGGNDGRRLS